MRRHAAKRGNWWLAHTLLNFEEALSLRILRAPEADGLQDEPGIVDDHNGLLTMGWVVVGDYHGYGPRYEWRPPSEEEQADESNEISQKTCSD